MTHFLHVAGRFAAAAATLDFRGVGRAVTLFRVLRTFDCVEVREGEKRQVSPLGKFQYIEQPIG
jgi:hypothetical protein